MNNKVVHNKQPKKKSISSSHISAVALCSDKRRSENQTQVCKTKKVWSWLIQNRPAGLSEGEGKLEKIWFYSNRIFIFHVDCLENSMQLR